MKAGVDKVEAGRVGSAAPVRVVEVDWLAAAAAEVESDLRGVAERYPQRVEWRDGKLRVRK